MHGHWDLQVLAADTTYGGTVVQWQERSTVTRTAGARAQLTAAFCGLRQATLPTCATWSGSEGHCMVEQLHQRHVGSRGCVLRRGAVTVHDCFQVHGPGIITMIHCKAAVAVHRYMAPHKWLIIVMSTWTGLLLGSRQLMVWYMGL